MTELGRQEGIRQRVARTKDVYVVSLKALSALCRMCPVESQRHLHKLVPVFSALLQHGLTNQEATRSLLDLCGCVEPIVAPFQIAIAAVLNRIFSNTDSQAMVDREILEGVVRSLDASQATSLLPQHLCLLLQSSTRSLGTMPRPSTTSSRCCTDSYPHKIRGTRASQPWTCATWP